MENWYKEPNWWVTIITFIIGTFGLISAEFGPFFNNAQIQFFTKNRIEIGHDYGSLYVDLPINYIKTGRGPKTIFKMQLYLQRYDGKYELLFDWNKSPITIRDIVSSQLDIVFHQEPDMEKYNTFFEIYNELTIKILDKYKKEGWSHKAYFLDSKDKEVEEIKKYVQKLIKDLIPSKYRLLLVALETADGGTPMWKSAYSFELSKNMKKMLIDAQLASYDSVSDFNPKYRQIVIVPFIEKLTKDEEEKLFNAYKYYFSKKPKN